MNGPIARRRSPTFVDGSSAMFPTPVRQRRRRRHKCLGPATRLADLRSCEASPLYWMDAHLSVDVADRMPVMHPWSILGGTTVLNGATTPSIASGPPRLAFLVYATPVPRALAAGGTAPPPVVVVVAPSRPSIGDRVFPRRAAGQGAPRRNVDLSIPHHLTQSCLGRAGGGRRASSGGRTLRAVE